MRDVVCIYTGQGAVGSFKQLAIFTGQFSSCSPVLMYNENNGRGGLYHLPGKNGDAAKLKNDEWHNLKAMLYMVEPTTVMLFPCGDYALRQSFIEGDSYNVSVTITDDDLDAADDDMELAKTQAFDRIYKGDQRELSAMFAKTKAARIMGYSVQLQALSFRGIQVTADDDGKLKVSDHLDTGLGGTTYDLKKDRFPPKEACAILNPDIDYGLWVGAT